MRVWYRMGVGLALVGMVMAGRGAFAQQVPPGQVQASCETRASTWQEYAQSFFRQIHEVDSQARDLRAALITMTKERDEALAKLKAQEASPQAAKENK